MGPSGKPSCLNGRGGKASPRRTAPYRRPPPRRRRRAMSVQRLLQRTASRRALPDSRRRQRRVTLEAARGSLRGDGNSDWHSERSLLVAAPPLCRLRCRSPHLALHLRLRLRPSSHRIPRQRSPIRCQRGAARRVQVARSRRGSVRFSAREVRGSFLRRRWRHHLQWGHQPRVLSLHRGFQRRFHHRRRFQRLTFQRHQYLRSPLQSKHKARRRQNQGSPSHRRRRLGGSRRSSAAIDRLANHAASRSLPQVRLSMDLSDDAPFAVGEVRDRYRACRVY